MVNAVQNKPTQVNNYTTYCCVEAVNLHKYDGDKMEAFTCFMFASTGREKLHQIEKETLAIIFSMKKFHVLNRS